MSLQLMSQNPTGPASGGCGGATSLDAGHGSENCRVYSHSHGWAVANFIALRNHDLCSGTTWVCNWCRKFHRTPTLAIVAKYNLWIALSPRFFYGASRLFDHRIRRRITFALFTLRRAYFIFRPIIVRGQILFLSFCNNDLQDLNF